MKLFPTKTLLLIPAVLLSYSGGVYLLEHGQNAEAAEHFKAVPDMRLTKEPSLKTAEVYGNMAPVP